MSRPTDRHAEDEKLLDQILDGDWDPNLHLAETICYGEAEYAEEQELACKPRAQPSYDIINPRDLEVPANQPRPK